MGSSSTPATASRRATTSAGWPRSLGCTRRFAGSARSTSRTVRRSRRSSRPRSSSSSKGSSSRAGSTRTAREPARSTGDDPRPRAERRADARGRRHHGVRSRAMTAGYTPDPRDLSAPAVAAAGCDALLARAARYARWDGTQTIPALDADEILDALADDVMAEGDLAEALRRLMERGWRTSDPTRPDLAGLNELRERLRRRREELQERYQLRDVLADVRGELDDIVAQERTGIERRLDEA